MLHKTVFAFLNRLSAIVTPQLICETILNLDWSVSVRFFLYYVSGSFHKVQKCKKKWWYWWYIGSVVFLPKNCLFCIIPFTRQGSIWSSSWRRTLKSGEQKPAFFEGDESNFWGLDCLKICSIFACRVSKYLEKLFYCSSISIHYWIAFTLF